MNPSLRLNPPSGACVDDPASEDCFRTGNGGNPELDPIESTNYDASLEYRLSESGLASIALFRRDIDGFISNFTTTVQDPELGQLRIKPELRSGRRLPA